MARASTPTYTAPSHMEPLAAAVADPVSGQTLFSPHEGRRAAVSGLPPDLLAQSARRLHVLALLYAAVFFLAGIFPALLFPGPRAELFSRFMNWGPGAISIGVALVVAALTRVRSIPVARLLWIGAFFEVASSYGIAMAEYLDLDVTKVSAGHFGLSWVAVWVLLFTVAVPSPPRRAALTTLASVSAVPVVVGLVIGARGIAALGPPGFFFGGVFPYLLVALMAWVGSRVIYALGREVTRARELGGYRLVERLGVGGMGEVWRARHRLLIRPAAIKLVRPELLGTPGSLQHRQAEERFEREAQATASLRSPHTVELYDFGVAADGTFYSVMELLDGFDLDTLVTRFGPVPAERVVHLLKQVCHSLGEAHQCGLVHRDIKPANVYVCRYGREVDFAKVLDFGMVKTPRDRAVDETQLTGEQTILGTPAFMAPELVLGQGTVDGRADLYAVGCLAYWLLTGEMVFTGKTSMEVLVQHVRSAPVPPSARSGRPVPPALDAIVLSCLAKDPAGRPASADALVEAFESVEMPAPWTAARAREWWDEHAGMHAAGAPDPGDGITQEAPRPV